MPQIPKLHQCNYITGNQGAYNRLSFYMPGIGEKLSSEAERNRKTKLKARKKT